MAAKIEHLGVAVPSLEEGLKLYRDLLGFETVFAEEVASERVKVVGLKSGDAVIELLEPTAPDSAIAKHIAKRGPGLHHVAVEVEDVAATLARLKAAGVQLVDDAPRPGSRGTRVAFVHPKGGLGVLIELVEHGSGHAR